MSPNHPLFPSTYNPSLTPDLSLDQLREFVTSLQQEGERALLVGDRKGLSFLEEAARLDPSSSHLFFRQGLVLFEFGTRQNCLLTLRKGAQKFKQATDLNPEYVEAWHAWSTTLEIISRISGKKEDLWDAKVKIEKAIELLSPTNQDLANELHWDAGIIYHQLAQLSGEADELMKAISHFEKSSTELMPPEFWNDFGKAYASLSDLLHDIRPVLKTIQCYKQAISQTLSNSEGWMGLGRSLRRLFHFTHENEHFQQAYDCFAAATQLKPHSSELWLERIELIIEAARLKKEPAKLRIALEKCEQAAELIVPPSSPMDDLRISVNPDRWSENQEKAVPMHDKRASTSYSYLCLLSLWAEAYALLGDWSDRIEFIRCAEQKIDQALNLSDKDDPYLMLQYGKCLHSFAKYYHDVDLYHQAIEQFQVSLSIDRTQLQGWLWMGKTYSTIFEVTDDLDALEKSLRFYQKALQIKSDPSLYFEMAALMIQQGEVQQDLEVVEHAIQYLEYLLQTYKLISYEHPEWFFNYGIALDLIGDLKEDPSLHQKALEAFINVLMFSPDYRLVHHRIGMVYSHLGELTHEVDYFYRALQHFRLAERQAEDEEMIYIDCAITWMDLAEHSTDTHMEENCLREAEQKLIHAAKLGSRQAFYQLACLYSLKESFDLSLFYLHKAHVAKALPPLEEIQDDAWLEGVRHSPEFQEFLALLQKS